MLSVKNLQKALQQFEFDLAQLSIDKAMVLSSRKAEKRSHQKQIDYSSNYSLQAIKRSYDILYRFVSAENTESPFRKVWKQILIELRRQ